MIEEHPFKYFLPEGADKLIIGSFPCFNGVNYGDWFYSGSGKSNFWNLMSEIFGFSVNTRIEKELLCTKSGIAITDIALKISRTKSDCSDSNLEIIEFNKDNIEHCLNRGIKKILFTSKYVENQFIKNVCPNNDIPTSVLLSPSPAVNIHIGSLPEYKRLKETKAISGTFDFKLLKYKEAFNN